MRVDRILYQKIFPTGMAYLNHKIGVEIQVEDGDDWDDCFKKAKAQVEQWNLESNPSYSLTMEYMKPSENVLDKEKERIEIAIDNCTLSSELKLLENDAIKHGLVAQYLNKKKEFQH